MRLDGFGLFVEDMGRMIRFYRDVLGFEIKEDENTSNVYLIKDGTLFLLYGRQDFEQMTSRKYQYLKGVNGHFEIALYVDTFDEVDAVTPLERQEEILRTVTDICRAEYDFEDFQQVTDFFKKVINICKQMNYSEFNGEKYNAYKVELEKLLATKQVSNE